MKAVRLHAFHQQPVVDQVPEPKIAGPLDVIVKIGGAGVCRTDLHIIEGQWDAAMGTPLPYILGHENAGWVHEIGSAVTSVAVDPRERAAEAVHVVAAAAGTAEPARDERMHDHRVADVDIGDPGADLVHPAGVLVAGRVRQLDL